jgi:hypothetical protein
MPARQVAVKPRIPGGAERRLDVGDVGTKGGALAEREGFEPSMETLRPP